MSQTRTLVLHLGMNKAGSTAIQASFRDYDDGSLRYVRLGAPNHSKAISTLVMAHPERLNAYRIQGLSPDRIRTEKQRFQNRLNSELALDRAQFVISGEGIAELAGPDIASLHALFTARQVTVRPIAYVREPVGFASSVFQQSVKFGGKDFVVTPPGYRNKFQKFLDLYGEGSVEFAEFARDKLRDRSVVYDFAERIGADPARVADVWVNERLAPEAVALLYFWNRESRGGTGSKAIVDARRQVIDLLGAGFSGRFCLGPRALAAALDARDIAWMEDTAGFALSADASSAAGDDFTVDSHADLEAIRAASGDGLVALLARHGVTAPRDAGTSALLDRLLQAIMGGTAKLEPERATAPQPVTVPKRVEVVPEPRRVALVAKPLSVSVSVSVAERAPGTIAEPSPSPGTETGTRAELARVPEPPAPAAPPPEGLTEALARAIFGVQRQAGGEGRWPDRKDALLAEAEAIIEELAARGVRFARTLG